MTVTSTDNRIKYAGNGATTEFSFPNQVPAAADLVVTLIASDGTETVQTLTTHYTLAGVGAGGSVTVTMVTAPASGESLLLSRSVGYLQGTDYVDNEALAAATLESDIDRAAIRDQQLLDKTNRALLAPESDSTSLDMTLPASASRASRVLAFDANGEPVTSALASTVEDIEGSVAAAAASETAAAASETAAAASAAAAADDAADISALVQNIPTVSTGAGDGAETDFTLSAEPVDKTALVVTLNGILQHAATYSVSGTTLTFDAAPPNGVAVEVRDLSSTAIVDAVDVSTLAALATELAALAAIEAAISTAAANTSDISDVADDLNGANTIGAAVTAAADAATAQTAAEAAQTAAEAAQSGAETAETNAETAQTAAETAETNAEAAQAAAETAQTAAETAQSGAETAETNAETAQTAAETAQAAAETAETNAAASAASAASAGDASAGRADLKARCGMLPPFCLPFPWGITGSMVVNRATVGSVIGIDGLIAENAGNARIEHAVQSGEPLGLLLETAATNLHEDSEAFASSATLDVTSNDRVAPDGETTADKLVPTTATGSKTINQVITHPDGATVTLSVFARAAGYDFIWFNANGVTSDLVWFNLATGEVGTAQGNTDARIVAYPDGWYRCINTVTLSGTTTTVSISVSDVDAATTMTGDGSSGVHAWGRQLETGDQATSYIPTTSSSATRAADLATLDLTGVDAFRPKAYTALVAALLYSEDGVLAEIGLATTAEMTLEMQSGVLHLTCAGGLDLTLASGLAVGDRIAVAVRMEPGNIAGACNGAAVVSASSAISFAGDAEDLQLGADLSGANGLDCIVSDLAFFGPVTDTQLQELSNA